MSVQPCGLDSPNLSSDNYQVARSSNTNFPVTANDLSWVGEFSVGASTGGTATYAGNGSINYRAPAAPGNHSFTYTVSNGCGGTRTATVSVTVNRRPTAAGHTMTVNVDDSALIDLMTLVADPDGDQLSIPPGQVTSSLPPGVSVSVNGRGVATVTASPTAVHRSTGTFRYTVTDGAETATATVNVTVIQPNRPPRPQPDVATMAQGATASIDVVQNDIDPDGDTLILTQAFSPLSPAGSGSVSLDATNKARVILAPCHTGTVTFSYWVTDGQGNNSGASGNVTITVTPTPNRRPEAANDTVEGAEAGTPIFISYAQLLGNDTDPDGSCDSISWGGRVPGSSSNGTATEGPTGITFTADAEGTASFSYVIQDSRGSISGPAVVSITVAAPPTTTTIPPPPTTDPPPTTTTPPETTAPPASPPPTPPP